MPKEGPLVACKDCGHMRKEQRQVIWGAPPITFRIGCRRLVERFNSMEGKWEIRPVGSDISQENPTGQCPHFEPKLCAK